MVPQADDFDHGLQGEDRSEDDVQSVHDVFDEFVHVVMVHAHRYHVHEDYQHDEHVEL